MSFSRIFNHKGIISKGIKRRWVGIGTLTTSSVRSPSVRLASTSGGGKGSPSLPNASTGHGKGTKSLLDIPTDVLRTSIENAGVVAGVVAIGVACNYVGQIQQQVIDAKENAKKDREVVEEKMEGVKANAKKDIEAARSETANKFIVSAVAGGVVSTFLSAAVAAIVGNLVSRPGKD